jgi:hypothetical protein
MFEKSGFFVSSEIDVIFSQKDDPSKWLMLNADQADFLFFLS